MENGLIKMKIVEHFRSSDYTSQLEKPSLNDYLTREILPRMDNYRMTIGEGSNFFKYQDLFYCLSHVFKRRH